MHYHIGKYDESRFVVPAGYADWSTGFERVNLIDRDAGSVHMQACISRLQPGGSVAACVHAYEKGIYVFDGEIELLREGGCVRLPADGYALIPYATSHAIRNRGATAARWFEIMAPQPKPASAFKDMFFTGEEVWPEHIDDAASVAARDCKAGLFVADKPIPSLGGELQQGLSVFRFMERQFGTRCHFMMRGEMAVGAYRTRHDHPIEEFYLGLSGGVVMEIENESFQLGPGDFAWTGVGASHSLRQNGSEPFRWLETQTPQFPPEFGTRNYVQWEKLRAGR